MNEGCPGPEDPQIKSIFELKWGLGTMFFKNFEKTVQMPEGLKSTHIKAIMTLRFFGHCTMSRLSSLLELEKGSFTPVASRMIDAGIISKERSPEDKRVYNLVLTEEGAAFADRFAEDHKKHILSVIEVLEPDEQIEYLELVGKLNEFNKKLLAGSGDEPASSFT